MIKQSIFVPDLCCIFSLCHTNNQNNLNKIKNYNKKAEYIF